jgi:phage terminase large subunit-like protein
VAYQRVLKWLLEQEMKRRSTYFPVVPIVDTRNKFTRITGVISGLASHGLMYIGPEHTIFAEQFEQYPDVEFDDDLDASAIALTDLSNPYLERADRGEFESDDDVEQLEFSRSCP